jgi:hypothetical protein
MFKKIFKRNGLFKFILIKKYIKFTPRIIKEDGTIVSAKENKKDTSDIQIFDLSKGILIN